MKTLSTNVVRAALSALLTVGFFVLIELGLGLMGEEWSSLYAGDPGYDWRVRPNLSLEAVPHLEEGRTFSVQTNDRGFRDAAIPTSGPWVLALGCSTTFGWGVEQKEVWTEVLESKLGVPVVNAGIPGHSSQQGKGVAAELLSLGPDAVILGWGLRDGQHTVVPDAVRRPATFPRNTRLFRLLAGMLANEQKGDQPRVSEAQFRQNLREVASLAASHDAQVLLLDMTERSDTPSHAQVLRSLQLPLLVPTLSDADHFSTDRIHLNVRGNQSLAEQLKPAIERLLNPRAAAPPLEPAPGQTP